MARKEEMKKVEVKKLWNGRVSLRDYIVDDALSKQQGIRVKYKDEMMMLSPGQLEKKFSMTECISRYNGKNINYMIMFGIQSIRIKGS
jgi:hypothetical protein